MPKKPKANRKFKPKKSIVKRVKVTAGGKILVHQPGRGHLRSRKTSKQLRKSRKANELSSCFTRQVKRMLGVE
jgi:ribosomal protein L35